MTDQREESDAEKEVGVQLTAEKTANSAPKAEERQHRGELCVRTSLGPGFVLWTPHTSTKDSVENTCQDSHTPVPSSVLVLMFTWLFCTPSRAARYVELYASRGWHVLVISSQLQHFLWPPRSKSFARSLSQVLKERCGQYAHTVVHAMSIGAYNYTTCQMVAQELPDLHTQLFGKLRGVVFDSLTMGSLHNMVSGIATGLSQWGVIRTATKSLANLYFFLTYKTTVQAFDEGVEFFRTRPARVPTLVLGSEADPMCEAQALRSMLQDWDSRLALPLSFRVWPGSAHCAHLLRHAEDYRRLLHKFLLSLSWVASPDGGGGGRRVEGCHPVSKL